MYICVCKAVTDRQIRNAVADGACTLRDLTRELGVGTGCGKCVPAAREALSACLATLPTAPTVVSTTAPPPLSAIAG